MAKQLKVIMDAEAAKLAAPAQIAPPSQQAEPGTALPYMADNWEGNQERKYGNVLYKDIIKELLTELGTDGGPLEGGRNMTLYRLARYLRHVCEFDVNWLLDVCPSWGLSFNERQQTIQSAVCSPRGENRPIVLERVLKRLEEKPEDEEQPQNIEEVNPIPAALPRLLRYYVNKYPRNKRCALLASLPLLGHLLTRLRSAYRDGRMESPIFMCVIVGPQASGKSFLRDMYDTLEKPILASDREQLKAEQEYEKELQRLKNAVKQPEVKTFKVRCLPANTSNTQLLKRVDSLEGLSVLSFAPEIDSVYRMNTSGSWAEKGDIYRVGFEGGLYGQDMASTSSYSGIVELRYNLLFSGTDMAVRRFFKNVENGMMSRFCFAQMADDRGQKLLAPKKDTPVELQFVEDEVKRLYELGSNPDPEATTVISLPRTIRALDAWEDDRIDEYLQTGDEALDILRRRACLLGFRAGMIGWALCGCRETDQVVQLAVWVAQEVLNQQLAMYGDQLNSQAAANRELRERNQQNVGKIATVRLFDELPAEFMKSDVEALRRKHKMNSRGDYLLNRWVKYKMCEKTGLGSYRKMPEHQNNHEQERKEE